MSDGATELQRNVKLRGLPAHTLSIEANEAERTALAQRFGVTAVRAMNAECDFAETGEGVLVTGALTARIVQPCAVTRDDFTYEIDETLCLLFVPAGQLTEFAEDEEIELDASAPDEIEYEGDSFDLGEALAQTLGLAIDPYREGPDADAARVEAGIESDEAVEAAPKGPLAEALRGLEIT